MLPSSDALTLNEWLALIQHDPEQAKKQVILFKARRKQQGLMADPSLTITIDDYDRAQQLLAAADNSQPAQQIEARAKIGRVTLGKLPDQEDWLALITADPALAANICTELELKHAMQGTNTPSGILKSIAIYRAI